MGFPVGIESIHNYIIVCVRANTSVWILIFFIQFKDDKTQFYRILVPCPYNRPTPSVYREYMAPVLPANINPNT